MYGSPLQEMAQVAEQEHMQNAIAARARARERRERRRILGPGRMGRAWTAFWAPRGTVLVSRKATEGKSTELTPCVDC